MTNTDEKNWESFQKALKQGEIDGLKQSNTVDGDDFIRIYKNPKNKIVAQMTVKKYKDKKPKKVFKIEKELLIK